MKKLMLLAAILSGNVFAQIDVNTLGNNNTNAQEEVFTNGVKIVHKIPGSGRSPSSTSTVKVEYKGKLKDGRVFDQSTTPMQFKLNGVVQWAICNLRLENHL